MSDTKRPPSLTLFFTGFTMASMVITLAAAVFRPEVLVPLVWLTATFTLAALVSYRIDGVVLLANETAEFEEQVESLRDFCTTTVEELKKQVPTKDVVSTLNETTLVAMECKKRLDHIESLRNAQRAVGLQR